MEFGFYRPPGIAAWGVDRRKKDNFLDTQTVDVAIPSSAYCPVRCFADGVSSRAA